MGSVASIIAKGPQPTDFGIKGVDELANEHAIAKHNAALATGVGLENQQRQQDLKDQKILSDALIANQGDPYKSLTTALSNGMSAKHTQTWIKTIDDHQKALAAKNDAALKDETDRNERVGGWLKSVIDAPEGETSAGIYHAMLPKLKPEEIQAWGLPAEYTPGSTKQILVPHLALTQTEKELIAQENKNRELKATEAHAAASTAAAATAKEKADREAAAAAQQDAATTLAAAARQGPDALQQSLDQLPHGLARKFQGLTDPDEILKLGMTPYQQAQAGVTKTVTPEQQYITEYQRLHPKATVADAVHQYAADTQRPPDPLVQQERRLNIQKTQRDLASAGQPIEPGTHEFRVAQDLAYGKLTMPQFRSLTAYSRDTNKKMAIYDKAAELNPNFNPAAFEMGYTLAKNPKVQQQLASLDNVQVGVPDLIKASDAASRTGATILNKAIIPGGIALGGKRYSNFNTARIAFADELSGALGYGSATDMSREMGFSMTNEALSPENFKAAIQDVVMPFVERKRGTLLKQMGIYGAPGMNPAAGENGTPARAEPGAAAPRLRRNYNAETGRLE